MAYRDYLDPVIYVRAKCYPVGRYYRVELMPIGGATPGPGWPSPQVFTSLGEAMAWAYAEGNRRGRSLDGLTLSAGPRAARPDSTR